ncbi:AlpA family transcriptional regulator [Lewinella sp. JB7]|uniref:helix-turn-helix transcriptional regulator n=1 Tax=Lewinella sp. JB7 TaxID=2962887 RepID=UPI0020CA1C84|nr:helix-turn-helix domain-containing protein [Lewinella sp. JB7]MCP9237081.1 helix-turn-helix domain-containing protein [Lewinella sp. JB7]
MRNIERSTTISEKEEASELPALITRQQAADLLSVSLSTVDNYIKDGLLQKKRVGMRNVRLLRVEVEKLARTV